MNRVYRLQFSKISLAQAQVEEIKRIWFGKEILDGTPQPFLLGVHVFSTGFIYQLLKYLGNNIHFSCAEKLFLLDYNIYLWEVRRNLCASFL